MAAEKRSSVITGGGEKRGSMVDGGGRSSYSGESKQKPRGINRMLPRRASRRTLAELQTEVKLLSAKTVNPGKANTLVMRTLDAIAKKYTNHGEDTLPLMQEVLSTQTGIMFFSNHLAGEYSSENIQFWEAVRDFPQNPSLKECRRIVDLYIREKSEFEVNILQLVRHQVLAEFEELGDAEPDSSVWTYKKNLFELAQNEVFNLMHRDSFPRFRRSRLYRLYKQKLALDTAAENRSEHKNRVNCAHPRCGREARVKGFCLEHEEESSTQGQLNHLAQVLHGIDSPPLTLQNVLDHPLGSSFFAHYCSLELKTAGEVRLQGIQRSGINPVNYFNCYKLILEFKTSQSYNAASLIAANHLERNAPCAVDLSDGLRENILKALEQSRNCANLASSLASMRNNTPPEEPLEVGFIEKFADEVEPLPAETFEDVLKVILPALDPIFVRFEASRWYMPCKNQMRDWDMSIGSTGSPILKASSSSSPLVGGANSPVWLEPSSVKEMPPLSI
jgi:regulator of G-protein signaling